METHYFDRNTIKGGEPALERMNHFLEKVFPLNPIDEQVDSL
jgi:hypothetical protein